jgi:hypothetical protein
VGSTKVYGKPFDARRRRLFAWVTVPTGDWFPDPFFANCDYGTTPRPPSLTGIKKGECTMAGLYWWLIEDQRYLEEAVHFAESMKDVRR